MKKEIVSKISLYDILAMFIPGGTLFVFILLVQEHELQFNNYKIDSVLSWIIVLIASYLLGLINHCCTSLMWKRLRNNPIMILYASSKEEDYMPCIGSISPYLVFILVTISITTIQTNGCSKYMIIFLPFLVYSILYIKLLYSIPSSIKKVKEEMTKEKKEDLLSAYYEAYYHVAIHRYSNDIFIMEGQVAFMQNMLLPLFCLLFIPDIQYYFSESSTLLRWLLTIGLISLPPTIYLRQYKIYQRVWEDYNYFKRYDL